VYSRTADGSIPAAFRDPGRPPNEHSPDAHAPPAPACCKRIVTPDGVRACPNSKPQPNDALIKALARAWRWQRMLDEGAYNSVSDIGEAESISKSYVSRILRLALLAPDIIEMILDARLDQALTLEQLERPLPARWDEQRQRFS
jgi:hypothetical protein